MFTLHPDVKNHSPENGAMNWCGWENSAGCGVKNLFCGENNMCEREYVSSCSMLKLNIRNLFFVKGIHAPHTWMTTRGIPDRAARQFLKGTGFRINYSYMQILCVGLHCTPDDLFTYEPNDENLIDAHHPLQKLRRENTTPDVTSALRELTVEEIRRVEGFVKGMKGRNNQ